MATGDIMPGCTGTGSPGAHGCMSALGWHGTRLWVQGQGQGVAVGVPVHPAQADPRPGQGEGIWGLYKEGEPPAHSASLAVTQPGPQPPLELCHGPPAPGQGRGQRGGTLGVSLLGWISGTGTVPRAHPQPSLGARAQRTQHPSLPGALRPLCVPRGTQSIPGGPEDPCEGNVTEPAPTGCPTHQHCACPFSGNQD